MGLSNLFKGAKKPVDNPVASHMAMPEKPKFSGQEAHDLVETAEEPMPPMPVAPMPSFTQKNAYSQAMPTKVEDEKSTFEIPDFSEEDLDLDLDMAAFTPGFSPKEETLVPVKPEIQQPQTISKTEQKKEFIIEEPKEEPEDPEFLPKFEVEPDLDMMREIRPPFKLDYPFGSKDNIKKVEAPIVQKKTISKVEAPKKAELFIEKTNYLEVLSREEEVIAEIKYLKQDLGKVQKYSDEQEAINAQLLDMAKELKEKLLALDSRLFGEKVI